jgi:hypothetical protein
MVFFSGLVFVLLIAQALTSEDKSAGRRGWPAGLLLVSAVLLSGSRSVFACMVIVTLLFVLVWHRKSRLRLGFLGLLGMAAILGVLFVAALEPGSQQESQGGVLDHVSSRFLSVSANDASLLAHASQMRVVAEAVRENPWLGRGPLASFWYFDPYWGWKETTFLDSGWGYLLMKTGLLGTGIFIWFAVGWLQMARGLRRAFPALIVAPLASFVFYLVFLLFGPSFFEFHHSWFIGLAVGQTTQLAWKFPMVRAAQVPGAPG